MSLGIKIGGSHSKWSKKGSSTTTSATTPTIPQWGSDLTQRIAGQVGQFADLNPGSLVAPEHELQQYAAKVAAGLGQWAPSSTVGGPRDPTDTNWSSAYQTADTPFASGGKAYDFVDRYLNPYLKDVVDTSAVDFDAQAGRTRAQQALDLAGSGAFGGSGAALTQSMTEGELSRARASTLAGLRSQAFQTAIGAAAGDADRATQARIANVQLTLQDRAQKTDLGFRTQGQQLAVDDARRADIATQAGLGETLRGVRQQQLEAPTTHAQQVVAMLSGLPIQLFTGQQTTGTTSERSSGKETQFNAEEWASTK